MKKFSIKTKTYTAALILMALAKTVNAQYDALFTQYMFNEMFINPAYAGTKEAMSATLLHRQQWMNFPGRPVTTSFALHGPLFGNKMGAGLTVLNDRVGVLNRNLVYGSYAYRLKIDKDNTISMGLSLGMDNQVNKLSELKLSNEVSAPVDPYFAGSPSVMAFNSGMGVYWTNNKKAFAGISIPRLLDNDIRFNSAGETVKITRIRAYKYTYYFTGGYLFDIKENYKLRTTAMIKLVRNAPAQLDITANLLINDMFWAGLSFRTKAAMSAIVGMQVNKQLLVSYSYDYGINKLRTYSLGSHEIAVNYLFSFTGKKIVTPRYF